VAEAGRCWILTDESRVALRAAFIRGRKRRTGSPAKWGENSATRAESAGTMKTFNSNEHNRLRVVGGPGQNTVESIKDRLVGPEFLTSDDPARVFHDKLSRDVKRLLGETDLSGIVIAERRAAIMPARKPAPTQRRSRPSPR
jgi:hypothetical protein